MTLIISLYLYLFWSTLFVHCVEACPDSGTIARNLVFDAGSTGTRPFLVVVERDSPDMKLKTFTKYTKSNLALSSITKATQFPQLRNTLQKSIYEALADTVNVPVTCRDQTGIILLATAGLRAISEALSKSILKEVENLFIKTKLKKLKPSASILSGFDEGLYFWISVNFLEQNFAKCEIAETRGIFEMGGGSVQIVAALSGEKASQIQEVTGHQVPLKRVLGRDYYIYSHSYLDGGIQAARIKYFFDNSKGFCIKNGQQINYSFNNVTDKILTGISIQDDTRVFACSAISKSLVSSLNVKGFNGLLDDVSFIGGSIFYYNAHSIYALENNCDQVGKPACSINEHQVKLSELKNYAKKYCSDAYLPADLQEPVNSVYICQDTTFIVSLLESGWQFPERDFSYTARLEIHDKELSWVLGAGLQLGFNGLNIASRITINSFNLLLLMAVPLIISYW
ncbi:hypothetical protein Ciccas_004114 [Cichlidogyrus casuarinus]|uniref:Uncharacterized protein n=1 Tax=Cichlidogyrus casuarinus TaxID=1844966 RepID=A0ABD2QCH7_9PLAT